jgi:hypothetical protein
MYLYIVALEPNSKYCWLLNETLSTCSLSNAGDSTEVFAKDFIQFMVWWWGSGTWIQFVCFFQKRQHENSTLQSSNYFQKTISRAIFQLVRLNCQKILESKRQFNIHANRIQSKFTDS